MGLTSTSITQAVALTPASVDRSSAALLRPSGLDASRGMRAHDNTLGVAIIDDRPLLRDCFGRSLTAIDPALTLIYYPDLETFEAALADEMDIRVVLACVSWTRSRAEALLALTGRLSTVENAPAVIVVSEIEDLNDVLKLIEHGIRGYIPTSDRLEVAAKAIELVSAGGIYLPPELLFQSSRIIKEMAQSPKQQAQAADAFTSRQMAVIEALRRGKANKIIAYELNMCESTVKVHIRNVMKKLKAKNRTELAFIFNNKMHQEMLTGGASNGHISASGPGTPA